MRVERLLVSANRRYIILGGEDGYIDVIDLDEELARIMHIPRGSNFISR